MKIKEIDIEGFGEPEQDSGGHGPLVALEVIEIGGGDADLVGHGGLI